MKKKNLHMAKYEVNDLGHGLGMTLCGIRSMWITDSEDEFYKDVRIAGKSKVIYRWDGRCLNCHRIMNRTFYETEEKQ